MKILGLLFGIVLAAAGGGVAYRAAFIDPRAAVVISETSAQSRELPNMLRLCGGIALLIIGTLIALISARRRTP